MALQPIANGRIFDPNTGLKATTGNYQNQYNFADQNFPDLKHELVKVWGNQNITGFLDTFGMEAMLGADTTFWAEDGRRRKVHTEVSRAGNKFTSTAHAVRENDYILVSDKANSKVEYGLVTTINDANSFTASFEGGAAWTVGATKLIVIAIGSEFGKGTEGKKKALTISSTIYNTSPVIKKDMYEETGSNLPNVSWITGTGGNRYWYIPEEQEAMFRFMDANEAQMILQNKINANSGLTTAGYKGTQGLFPAIRERGNNFQGKINSMDAINSIIKRLDKMNGETSNGLFVSTDHSLAIDDMLAKMNASYSTGTDFGVFGNKKDMVLELGFRGFNRGGFNFFKQTWKFLKDSTMFNPDNFAAANQVHGIMVPLGTTGIKNTIEGNPTENVPYLTMMYKGKPGYSRKLVTNFHGSQMVPDATDTRDVYGVDWLSESCLRPCGMQRWMLFEGA